MSSKTLRQPSAPRKSGGPFPAAYLITFACYGTRFHGDPDASVDRDHNIPGTPRLPANSVRVYSEQKRTKDNPYRMDERQRRLVLEAFQEVCHFRGWKLLAAHVRSSHVHAVVVAEARAERILQDFKSYSSRVLNRAGEEGARRNRWARHGSTRYLWKPEQIGAAIHYVVREQGEAMALWEDAKALR